MEENTTTTEETKTGGTTTENTEVAQNNSSESIPFGKKTKYSPFKGNAENRTHATPVVNTNIQTEIPEATYAMPVIDEKNIEATLADKSAGTHIPGMDVKDTSQSPSQQNTTTTPQEQTSVLTNPAAGTLTPEEQDLAAKQSVETFYSLYEKLHGVGRWFMKPNEKKLEKEQKDGKINLDMRIPTEVNSQGQIIDTLSLREFTKELNKEIDKEIKVTEDFKNATREPLTRICRKKGWFMTDENYVLYKIGEDLATKVSLCVGFQRSLKEMYQDCRELHEESENARKEEAKQRALTIEEEVAKEVKQQMASIEAELKRLRDAAAANKQPKEKEEELKTAA